ncbi:MAG TPA: chromosomal replication initiator protein DnaA [Rhabdochlamydiaceae bacterium]|nr:chromosomal replication initiator protein DnaA [Rhabdochlamydiaceae bacterium]
MLTKTPQETWADFLAFIAERCSGSEFENWFAPIKLAESASDELVIEVPNIFVQSYITDNYKKDLEAFIPKRSDGTLALSFVIKQPEPKKEIRVAPIVAAENSVSNSPYELKLNPLYTFVHFIEGPANQFVKSAAMGVAARPSRSYNPLFIHGGVGLGKTHLLHAVGHYIKEHHKKLRIHLITTEEFINDLVDNLRNKSMDKMKRFYRSLDVLLVDDIQFLQSRLNFEEEFCNTFESLINQNKQIVITSDKPPGQLKLSERMVARMEWGLVANVGVPDLETRVAILQHKAEQRGFKISQKISFFIAERIFNNVRQLEGALNRLSAFTRMMGLDVTEEVVEKILSELFQNNPNKRIAIENVLKSVATIFGVRVSDLCGKSRTKEVAFPRQVAMYLAREMINESLIKLASYFGGKTHSTLLHAWKKVSDKVSKDETLRRQIQMARRNLEN